MNVARFEGGPIDGATLGMALWPPPPTVVTDDPTGKYVLARASQLPDAAADHPYLARGCTYRWESG